MPSVSLVVIVHKQRDLLTRLLASVEGCCDDLLVVHDGSDEEGLRSLVEGAGGRFFERPRAFGQEAHRSFAWSEARFDWILRMDADEFPSEELKQWLRGFCVAADPGAGVSGYTCIMPLWNGHRIVTKNWYSGQLFLYHRQRIKNFGMPEQSPMSDGGIFEPLPLRLYHQPKRATYGFSNFLFRPQAWTWRRTIAHALLGKPTDLPCWRWTSEQWPLGWEQFRQRPLWTGFKRLIKFPVMQAVGMIRVGEFPILGECLQPAIHHFLIGVEVWRVQRKSKRPVSVSR